MPRDAGEGRRARPEALGEAGGRAEGDRPVEVGQAESPGERPVIGLLRHQAAAQERARAVAAAAAGLGGGGEEAARLGARGEQEGEVGRQRIRAGSGPAARTEEGRRRPAPAGPGTC
ncbi:hypothetical protein [Methylobacterium oxalidis]|uniref:Uncharacterized protein n=1 Tax=Methylobacterium oxalidis TaxID=944322 RepID=A0A512J6J1_9HYPH|nr:hypothetical protein [Methylobacterium oxalidis]GEP05479.1 hypothetical protein MOX02_35170 [Methylobacterium oxalidis]GLS63057.1 hypothetical protein GCM10007888_14380 [Methylobacterium oxalidis]